MRGISIAVWIAVGAVAGCAAEKIPVGRASNEAIEIQASLYNGKDAVRQQVGSDLDGYFVIVKATVTPKAGRKVQLFLDDFLMRSDKDGETSRAFAPSQIAGRATLVVSSAGGGAGITSESGGPIWGGYPGTGMPGRLGGQSATMGNMGTEGTAQASHENKKGDSALLATLKEKVLPEKEISEPVTGLLYFQLDGKHKTKQLEMIYKGDAGKLSLRFRVE